LIDTRTLKQTAKAQIFGEQRDKFILISIPVTILTVLSNQLTEQTGKLRVGIDSIDSEKVKHFQDSLPLGRQLFANFNFTPIDILFDIAVAFLTISIAWTALEIYRKKKATVEVMGDAVNGKQYLVQFLITYIIQQVFTFLWTLLFLIPGLIKSFSYSMTFFCMKDALDKGESISFTEAITRSRKLMDGHKFDYFWLQLSFIPWYLLVAITFGVANVYVLPYINATKAVFYQELLDNNI
jgi:uncharacterized membrane protein